MNYDDRIESIENEMAEIKRKLAACMIDTQLVIKRDNKVKPTTGTKLAYNADGLVTGSFPLTEDDIPDMPPTKIKGLKKAMDEVNATRRMLDEIQSFINQVYDHSKTVHTGTKVNIDEHGFVNDVSNLIQEDIPQLPISKIEGLQNILDSIPTEQPAIATDDFTVKPNTGSVIQYDYKGRIVNSRLLEIEDLPSQLISRIDRMENAINSINSSIEELKSSISGNENKTIPGTYTKLTISKDGTIIGSNIEKEDLPSISIDDISNLRETLMAVVSNHELEELRSGLMALDSKLSRFENKPSTNINEWISMEIKSIKSQISQLSSRLYQLEKY